jgi:hypothetical protein
LLPPSIAHPIKELADIVGAAFELNGPLGYVLVSAIGVEVLKWTQPYRRLLGYIVVEVGRLEVVFLVQLG